MEDISLFSSFSICGILCWHCSLSNGSCESENSDYARFCRNIARRVPKNLEKWRFQWVRPLKCFRLINILNLLLTLSSFAKLFVNTCFSHMVQNLNFIPQFLQRNRTIVGQTNSLHNDEVCLLWENGWSFIQVCCTQAKVAVLKGNNILLIAKPKVLTSQYLWAFCS